MVTAVTHPTRLRCPASPRPMSESWTKRCGLSCSITPMSAPVPIYSFPPQNPPPLPGSQPRPPPNCFCITGALHLLHLLPPLQLDPPDHSHTPQAMLHTCRYILMESVRAATFVMVVLVTFSDLFFLGGVTLQSKNTVRERAPGGSSKVDGCMVE